MLKQRFLVGFRLWIQLIGSASTTTRLPFFYVGFNGAVRLHLFPFRLFTNCLGLFCLQPNKIGPNKWTPCILDLEIPQGPIKKTKKSGIWWVDSPTQSIIITINFRSFLLVFYELEIMMNFSLLFFFIFTRLSLIFSQGSLQSL